MQRFILILFLFIVYVSYHGIPMGPSVVSSSPSLLLGSASLLISLVSPVKKIDTTFIKDIVFGEDCISEKYIKDVQTVFPTTNILPVYNVTEAGGCLTCFKPIYSEPVRFKAKFTSCGTPMFGYSIKIVDVDTEQSLGPYRLGELRYKGDSTMNGFYNMHMPSIWDKAGWIKSGDLAYFDKNYCVYVTDHIRDDIKYKSMLIDPDRVEHILLTHPGVTMALVVGIPHEEDGEHALALVVLKKGYDDVVDDDVLNEYLHQYLKDTFVLKAGIKIVNDIPKTRAENINFKEIKRFIFN